MKRSVAGLDVSQELRVLKGAKTFRRLAPAAWSSRTIYPKSVYEPGSPLGQCGVTNFGAGIWFVWHGIAEPSQMWYEEGEIVSASGEPLGEDHAWLRVNVEDDYQSSLPINLDMAGDQYPAVSRPVFAQYPDYHVPDPERDNVTYQPVVSTPLAEYDSGRFGDRLWEFMSGLGAPAVAGELWLPHDSAHTREQIFIRLARPNPQPHYQG